MKVESVPTGCILDVEGTLARFGGDSELFVEMAGFFLEDAPVLYSDLCDAAKSDNACRGAHESARRSKGWWPAAAVCGLLMPPKRSKRPVRKATSRGLPSLLPCSAMSLRLLKQAHLEYRR